MSSSTTNYGLVKPSYDESADVSIINANMDKIDTALKGVSDIVSTHTTNISALQESVSSLISSVVLSNVGKIQFSSFSSDTFSLDVYDSTVSNHMGFTVNGNNGSIQIWNNSTLVRVI